MTIKLTLGFKGTDFNGFQVQNIGGNENPALKTVQGSLNKALRILLQDNSIEVVGGSRTDAGVHAREYIASFDVENPIVPPEKISLAIKHLLPESISVFKSEIATPGFNARFDTISKTYHYYFYTGICNCPVFLDNAYHVKTEFLDLTRMQEAAKFFIGEHDFTSFATAQTEEPKTLKTEEPKNRKTNVRTIFDLEVSEVSNDMLLGGKMYCLSVTGDGFLYNMVRIITGTVIMVGEGKIEPSEIKQIIDLKDRKKAGITAPACGLYLYKVKSKK